ncbi:MAG: YXWGXW repeat-containing protein [Candidatus Tyrphobacter sp.]
MKRILFGLALIAGMAGFGFTPASAQVFVHVRLGPPAPRYERVPRPRRGYIWRAGHYAWSGGRWVWIGGVWIGNRRGCVWVPAHWARGYWRDGHWRC